MKVKKIQYFKILIQKFHLLNSSIKKKYLFHHILIFQCAHIFPNSKLPFTNPFVLPALLLMVQNILSSPHTFSCLSHRNWPRHSGFKPRPTIFANTYPSSSGAWRLLPSADVLGTASSFVVDFKRDVCLDISIVRLVIRSADSEPYFFSRVKIKLKFCH